MLGIQPLFHTFFPLTNLAIVSKIICTGIVGNPTVVSIFFSSHKSSHSFKNEKLFALGLLEIQPLFHTFFPLTNLAIVSKIICTGIVGNPTVVSNFFSSHKRSHSFKNYLHWDYWKSNRCFTLFFLSQI